MKTKKKEKKSHKKGKKVALIDCEITNHRQPKKINNKSAPITKNHPKCRGKNPSDYHQQCEIDIQ